MMYLVRRKVMGGGDQSGNFRRAISHIPPLLHVPRCGPIGLRGEEGKGEREAGKRVGGGMTVVVSVIIDTISVVLANAFQIPSATLQS